MSDLRSSVFILGALPSSEFIPGDIKTVSSPEVKEVLLGKCLTGEWLAAGMCLERDGEKVEMGGELELVGE